MPPFISGTTEPVSSVDEVISMGDELGWPVAIKASAGGGGKGMRVVKSEDDLQAAIESAQREAEASFGDGRLFLEPWVHPVRHVEVQILGDTHGNLVHLFERECSIQRRHQKIIEECPSPVVDEETRKALGEAALAAGRRIGYFSAGTVEFLFSQGKFWFLEVNTRLQVEHPVTEMVTGVDLVREQIRIAEGEPLGFGQEDLGINGHAIEARVYAEDPMHEFLPAAGEVIEWRPEAGDGVRFDSGIETGSRVGIEFDPMIAKVIAAAPTRREAVAKLARALSRTRIHGPRNNRDFLVQALRTREFLRGDTTTDFLERVSVSVQHEVTQAQGQSALIACAVESARMNRTAARVLRGLPGGWRNSPMPPMRMRFEIAGAEQTLEYRQGLNGHFVFTIEGEVRDVLVYESDEGEVDFAVDGVRSSWWVSRRDHVWFVQGPFGAVEAVELPRFPATAEQAVSGAARAPMPGKVLNIRVNPGDEVQAGDLLLTLEAMKMEHQITAPIDGRIAQLLVTAGEQVANGAILVVLEEPEEQASARTD